VGGRSLYIECRGTGEPTVILEPGEAAAIGAMAPLGDELVTTNRVCAYDRANKGMSDSALTPRKAQQIVDDLEALLLAAEVPAPYVLVGQSAGADFVWLYASQHPDDVTGFISMNPVPFTLDVAALEGVWTEAEIADEQRYLAGENGEGFDYAGSGPDLVAATPPPAMPYVVMISTAERECGSPTDVCARAFPLYEAFTRALAARTPSGRFMQVVDAGHEIFLEEPQIVLDEVRKLLGASHH
jgi:pimeloyl-ACP methyl ester carboxylesterase